MLQRLGYSALSSLMWSALPAHGDSAFAVAAAANSTQPDKLLHHHYICPGMEAVMEMQGP
jgi:hypothetical protein